MCICINCLYVNKCGTYYIIEKQHNQSHLNSNPLFIAHSPILNVSVTSDKLNIKIDWDVVECLSYIEDPGKWLNYYK
uniref:hypothetical protein n=1 Tax=Pulvinaster venetus TaxID=427767 RepID=UPI001FCD1515|nr:hypothetical protein MW436_pgp110 [Pulvinaster venetus]UNJ16949.1 hypothetical protein [Pulvinaster venetus]